MVMGVDSDLGSMGSSRTQNLDFQKFGLSSYLNLTRQQLECSKN